ncbi:MAG TPA: alcohol dehydrogenase, partial [Eubacteriaceae bacterium]|nr:alcohol dehydrogenase [Eubacteriaceae bacterium]
LQSMKMFGATSLTLSEPIEERRELAKKFGADYVIDPVKEDVVEKALELTDGRGYDAVVDCSGSPRAGGG